MVTYKEIKADTDLQKAFAVRRAVFSAQGFDVSVDVDGKDTAENTFHVLVEEEGKAVATGRIVIKGGVGRVGRMAVLEEYQKRGIGTKMFEFLKNIGIREGTTKIVAGSQNYCTGFYEKMGLTKTDEQYDVQGTGHTKMSVDLAEKEG